MKRTTESAKRGPGRPPGKAETIAVLLPLSPDSWHAVTQAAESAGLSRVEWLRRAAAYCLALRVPLIAQVALEQKSGEG